MHIERDDKAHANKNDGGVDAQADNRDRVIHRANLARRAKRRAARKVMFCRRKRRDRSKHILTACHGFWPGGVVTAAALCPAAEAP